MPIKLNETFKQVIFAPPQEAQQALIQMFATQENLLNEKIMKWIINITSEKKLKALKQSTQENRLEITSIKEDLVDALLDTIFFHLIGSKDKK